MCPGHCVPAGLRYEPGEGSHEPELRVWIDLLYSISLVLLSTTSWFNPVIETYPFSCTRYKDSACDAQLGPGRQGMQSPP